jgi:hypothetical protein
LAIVKLETKTCYNVNEICFYGRSFTAVIGGLRLPSLPRRNVFVYRSFTGSFTFVYRLLARGGKRVNETGFSIFPLGIWWENLSGIYE